MDQFNDLSLSLRRLLDFVSKEYVKEKEIAKKHFAFHPLSLESYLRLSKALRSRAFREEKSPTFDELMDHLVARGYVEVLVTSVDPKNPTRGLGRQFVFYRLTEKGVSAKPNFGKKKK